MRQLPAIFVGVALLCAAAPVAEGAPYRGRIEIRHADDFARQHTRTSYRLLHSGRATPLVLTRAPRTPSGSQVVVNGRRSGSRIRGTVRSRSGLLRAASVTPGARKTAVILINFTSDTRTPWTPAAARTSVFTSSTSANAFYSEDSYGDVSLVGKTSTDGDVFGWYTIAGPVGTCTNSNVDTWTTQADAKAAADGFSASGYQHVIYAFPQQAACTWSGLGELPGTRSWMNGSLAARVVAHELGHNMGLHHASTITCTSGGVTVAYSSTCGTPDEYGDPFDVMGKNLRRNNGWHLQQIGFLGGANVQTTAGSGTYTLNATGTRGTGTQLLRVPRAGTSPQLYYDLELRASGGVFDNFLSTDPAVNGVTVHVDPSAATITQSLLIDTTPGSSGGFNDAPLVAGRTFTDGDISIAVSAVSGNTATVNVAGALAPDDVAPSAPAPLVAEPAADHVTLTWPAATDNVGVAGYGIYRDGSLLATRTATSLTDTSVIPGRTYAYRVSAYDAAGNSASSATVYATVPPAAAPTPAPDPGPVITAPVSPPVVSVDSTRPVVHLVSPSKRARLRRSAVVRAFATDDTGVAHIDVWVDGVRRRSVHGKRLSWRWRLRGVRPGRHLIVVRAYDARGNAGRLAARVHVAR